MLGGGLKERADGGLTYLGDRAVERMNKLGVVIDISHCGDRTGKDVIAASRTPVLITHAGARTVWPTSRMKDDETIRACAERGGVNRHRGGAAHHALARASAALARVRDGHFTYCVDLVGIEHVSFGPDTLFGDHVGLHDAFAANLSIGQVHGSVDFQKVPYVDGLENPAEGFYNIVGWLVAHGYGDDEIARSSGGTRYESSRSVGLMPRVRTTVTVTRGGGAHGAVRLRAQRPAVGRRPAGHRPDADHRHHHRRGQLQPARRQQPQRLLDHHLMYPHLLSIRPDGKKAPELAQNGATSITPPATTRSAAT